MYELSVFLPVYNEEKILEKNTRIVYDTVKSITKGFEICIVDDSSTDKTPEVAKKLAKDKRIRHIRFENGPSRRENLGIAFKKARGDIIGFMDIDLASDIKKLKVLIKKIRNGSDIAIGSRYKGKRANRKGYRKLISYAYNTGMKVVFQSTVKDHQCGFKFFKKDVVMKLIDRMGYDANFKRGWFWDAELLIRAQKAGYKISEVPVRWRFGAQSSFNVKRELRMLPHVFGLRIRL